jgi:hypothetical protein
VLAASLVGASFYPMLKGHALGQVQVFMNLALGAALLLLLRRPAWSGVLVGLCCLLKPQGLVFLLWGLPRRRWRFLAGLVGTVAVGELLAVALYGLEVHAQYVHHLQALAQQGEAFWPNQSVNGVLNRLLQTGDPISWAPAAFPRFHPVVRWGTVLSSTLLLVAALVPPRRTVTATALELDFAAMLAVLTIASPIAWEHHYGSFLPLFALLLAVLAAQPRWPRWSGWALGVSFVLVANAVLRPEWFFGNPLVGLFDSHLWLGAMVLVGLLLVWRARLGNDGVGAT